MAGFAPGDASSQQRRRRSNSYQLDGELFMNGDAHAGKAEVDESPAHGQEHALLLKLQAEMGCSQEEASGSLHLTSQSDYPAIVLRHMVVEITSHQVVRRTVPYKTVQHELHPLCALVLHGRLHRRLRRRWAGFMCTLIDTRLGYLSVCLYGGTWHQLLAIVVDQRCRAEHEQTVWRLLRLVRHSYVNNMETLASAFSQKARDPVAGFAV